MKTFLVSEPARWHFFAILMVVQLFASGCSFNVTRYTDGPLTQYLAEPIPQLHKPIARTLSLEKVMYMTASNMKAIMISDLVAREIYIIPEDVGVEVKKQLKLDDEFSLKATYEGLNTIARHRAKARQLGSNKPFSVAPSTDPVHASTEQIIKRQESMAKDAYSKGDYLSGNIHTSAAMNHMMIDQSFGQAQATVGLAFSVLGAVQAAGETMIKSDFINLRNWIETKSGAIGAKAPEGNHLSVFFLQFFDAESFQLDSRNRVAVFMVLTDKNGATSSVLEGSDILNCEGECNLFKPKPTATIFATAAQSAEVQKQFTPEGIEYLSGNGFDSMSGMYQYILIQHGLQKLSARKLSRGK